MSPEEARKFWAAVDVYPVELLRQVIYFAVETAARQGEILNLRKADVDLERRRAIFRDTKNGMIAPRCRPKRRRRCCARCSHPTDPVFPTTHDVITTAWRHILKQLLRVAKKHVLLAACEAASTLASDICRPRPRKERKRRRPRPERPVSPRSNSLDVAS